MRLFKSLFIKFSFFFLEERFKCLSFTCLNISESNHFLKHPLGRTRKMNLVYDKSLLVGEGEIVCRNYKQII